jgi:hypothetical protein
LPIAFRELLAVDLYVMLVILVLLLAVAEALATPLRPSFTSCLPSYPPIAAAQTQLLVTDAFADLLPASEAAAEDISSSGRDALRLNLFGLVNSTIQGYDPVTNKLGEHSFLIKGPRSDDPATLFVDTTEGGLAVYSLASWLCESLFPGNDSTPIGSDNSTFCPLMPGQFGINITIPLFRTYALTTIKTQVRIVDTSSPANTLSCIDILLTPYTQTAWYYTMFRWLPVALAMGYWMATWSARFAAGWVVGSGVAEYDTKEGPKGSRREANMRKWGTMIVSGLSGERLSVSGGLLRFGE